MANAIANRILEHNGEDGRHMSLPVDGGTHIYLATCVAQLIATRMLVPGSTAASGPCIGVSTMEINNTGADGDKRCWVETDRIFAMPNAAGGDAFTDAHEIGSLVWMLDDHTAADNDGGGTRQVMGIFYGFEADGKVRVFISPTIVQVLAGLLAPA
jgi:hypothetical protein